jgi:UDP-N-acetylmuramate: L-alanyl-gamma-D-glutamyl-meso-diaminopimelate ligase
MKIFILGICGTFMSGIATIAKQAGYTVSGCDAGVYPPMSDYLQELNIPVYPGYHAHYLSEMAPDLVIVGNALSRGNPCIEALLSMKIPYQSGPEWLATHILRKRRVIAVAGTHGKTTTASMLTWILAESNTNQKLPGYLIGGIAHNFKTSANMGDSEWFVIEADEYDTAFFDKRPKFIHYHPEIAIVNNLEFDHADIYPDLAAIERQVHYLFRTIPPNGHVIVPECDEAIQRAINQGCWSMIHRFGGNGNEWDAKPVVSDASEFLVYYQGELVGEVGWNSFGMHNMYNGLAALIAAVQCGIHPKDACDALGRFGGVKRRLELRGQVNGIRVYDDFAHHPTAILKTIQALRQRVGQARIFAVVDFASNSMSAGVHLTSLPAAFHEADWVICVKPQHATWDSHEFEANCGQSVIMTNSTEMAIDTIQQKIKSGDHVLIMSNKKFDDIHNRLLVALAS